MAKIPTFFVGNRNPAITQTITINGVAVDLTGSTVTFRMRPMGSSTLKVNAAAQIVNASAGQVQYVWAAPDVDTAGVYLCWWVVTSGGKTQDVAEQVIEFAGHTPPHLYVEPEELKAMIDINGNYGDDALLRACSSASRAIDIATKRRFWLDADATKVRTYTPTLMRLLQIDDLVALTSLKIDRGGDGTYEETWTQNTDFVFEPQNNPVEDPAKPWEWIEVRKLGGRWFPVDIERSVQVIGQFGWPVIPDDIRMCATVIATKTFKRLREAPFGVIAVGGPESGIAMRIAKTDPDVAPILCDYERKTPWL